MRRLLRIAWLLAALTAPGVAASGGAAEEARRPLVIAHRGASQYLPEHTMEAYRLAIRMGADFVEPDLFVTADGVPVARHDRALNATTDVAAAAARDPALFARGVGEGEGRVYHVDSLTFAELRRLSALSRGTPGYAPRGAGGPFRVPAFGEVLDELRTLHCDTGRIVGVYPEVKTAGRGLDAGARAVADAMLAELRHPRHDGFFDGRSGNVILQSFDEAVIRYLDAVTELPLLLLTGSCPPDAAASRAIADFADGVGVAYGSADRACIERVQAAGLFIHVYTLSNLHPGRHAALYALGVDGIFSNAPDTAIAARDALFPPRPAR